jgi:DNA-binding NarL/FixJ family response regulator
MTTEPTHPPQEGAGAADPLTIFLVEDSTIIRDNLVDLMHETLPLRLLGSAGTQDEAVAALRDGAAAADLVIIDIFLKGGSGLGVLSIRHEVAAAGRWVVLSNHTTPEMRRKCVELGADAVFDKSNEIEALLLYCKRLVGLDTVGDVRNSLEAALD